MATLVLASTSPCAAQTFGLPGRVTRPDVALSQPAPPAAPSQTPKRTSNTAPGWGFLFGTQVERCWKKPRGNNGETIEAIFAIKLKRDGLLEAVRIISPIDPSPYGKAYQSTSFHAIMNCQPYKLPDADYDEWRFFDAVFTERAR